MRIPVTVRQAPPEFAVQQLIMRQTVTILAAWYGGMLSTMAVDAVYAAVKRCGCGKILPLLVVTHLTEFCRDPAGWNNFPRLVRRMTLQAVAIVLLLQVRAMAIQATGDETVPVVTMGTEEVRMPAC